jgi:hypothetical protein
LKKNFNTMSTDEHDLAIIEHLERLIDGAKKRTQGKWTMSDDMVWAGNNTVADLIDGDIESNAAYTVSCSENAEAGWLSTILAINGLKIARQHQVENNRIVRRDISRSKTIAIIDKALDSIRSLWPIEKLK